MQVDKMTGDRETWPITSERHWETFVISYFTYTAQLLWTGLLNYSFICITNFLNTESYRERQEVKMSLAKGENKVTDSLNTKTEEFLVNNKTENMDQSLLSDQWLFQIHRWLVDEIYSMGW